MRIDGKALAQGIFDELRQRVTLLKEKNIIPHLVIFLVGDDPASQVYVKQKVLKAEAIGAKATVYNLPSTVESVKLLSAIQQCSNDSNVHGIIVQRPLPPHTDPQKINQAVDTVKDIDSFRSDSPYPMPLAASVLFILEQIAIQEKQKLLPFLQSKTIVVMGKGETGGGPTIELLQTMGLVPHVIDSKTNNPDAIIKIADIIVAAIGKSGILKTESLKQGVILIAVGMHKGPDGKLHGDFEESDVANIASFYTPVPGGVGPVNVAMLLKNLITAAETISSK